MARVDCRSDRDRALEEARSVVEAGDLLVLPTDTVYGVGADPLSREAVDRLLSAKGRGRDKPSPVLIGSPEDAERLATHIPPAARGLMDEFWPGALTIILPAREEIGWDLGEANGTVALRMPDDEFTIALLRSVGPLAVTSANRTGEPPALTVDEAEEQLGGKVSLYLDGGTSRGGAPSTIVIVNETVEIVRHGAISETDIHRVVAASR